MPKQYNLEERTLTFAKNVRNLVKQLRMSISNKEDSKQLIRATGSVGANYREANESVSKKDFAFRIKICRKEAKASEYWLNLIDPENDIQLEHDRLDLRNEALELVKIFNAILQKAS